MRAATRRLKIVVCAAAAATLLMALETFHAWWAPGWFFSSDAADSRTVPATALALALGAAAIISAAVSDRAPWLRSVVTIAGVLTALLGVARLLGAEHLGFSVVEGGRLYTMSPLTALDCIMCGLAICFVCRRSHPWFFQSMCLGVALTAWLGISRHFYAGEPLLLYADMSLPTAVAFAVQGTALLALRPDTSLFRLLSNEGQAGVAARRLLPAAFVLPVGIGALWLLGQRVGWFGLESGVSLVALTMVIVFVALIWSTVHRVAELDAQRAAAAEATREQLERLALLREISTAIQQHREPTEIFRVLLEELGKQLGVQFGAIARRDEVGGEFILRDVRRRGLAAESMSGYRPGGVLSLSPEEACELKNRRAIEFGQERDMQRAGAVGLMLPMFIDDEWCGVLMLARDSGAPFDTGTREFLMQLSEQVALAWHHAQLYAQLKRVYQDLYESQRAAAQHERLRAIGELASGIAHDINNSIAPMSLYSDVLLREEGLSDVGREAVRTMRLAVKGIAQTLARLRQVQGARRKGLPQAAVNVNDIVVEVVKLTQSRWQGRPGSETPSVGLAQDLWPERLNVVGVAGELRDALVNLVLNAVHAMPNGGRLQLRTSLDRSRPPESRVVVEVSDTGAGMSDEIRRRCLEPFFTTKGRNGSGLGLATVLRVAKQHGAELQIDSQPGKGTTVRLVFDEWLGTWTEPRARERGQELKPLKLLIVDDDQEMLRAFKRALSGDGHSVTACEDGSAALVAVSRASKTAARFDCVITDLGMPDVDGFHVADEVKRTSPSTPVVLLTGWGYTIPGDIPNVDRVLSKPPDMDELREVLSELTGEEFEVSSASEVNASEELTDAGQ